jgi:hypothetical protein
MTPKQHEQLTNLIDQAMRLIQVADDEMERQGPGGPDPEHLRNLLQRCQGNCAEALRLLPTANGT